MNPHTKRVIQENHEQWLGYASSSEQGEAKLTELIAGMDPHQLVEFNEYLVDRLEEVGEGFELLFAACAAEGYFRGLANLASRSMD